MKKLLVAILAFLYITSSTGATVHVHYCMGKLASWGIGHNDAEKCGKCGMKKSLKTNNGCCKDENKFIKNSTDQKTNIPAAFQLIELTSIALPVSFFELPVSAVTILTEENPCSNAPPRSSCVAVYILNCTYRI